MWTFNTDYNKWVTTNDLLSKSNFDYLKQELVSTRFYSKCLSGATYLPVNNLDNIYDILGEYEPRNWFISLAGSQYSNAVVPALNATPINQVSEYDYYQKYISEYGLTLKNLFTPDRLIKDSIKNYIYVDVATIGQIINLNEVFTNLTIDGVRLINGHRLLVKDQMSTTALPFDTDPNSYFKGPYYVVQDYGTTIEYKFYNSENGIYLFNNNRLTKTNDLSLYEDCIRYSVSVKLGNTNTQKQFHLSRLLNGYYPTTSLNEPIEFIEKHNWLLRNRVDYNNLFEINYYDIVKYDTESFNLDGVTYSIPERTIAVGEFGVILNTQYGTSTIVPNKYKVNLRSITKTEKYYWICGDEGIVLRVSKSDFSIKKIDSGFETNLKSISFYNNLKGVIVGELNTILITKDGGNTWDKIIVDDFSAYYYNKVIFYASNIIYIVGNTGVFLELHEDITGWDVYKRRVSRFIDDYEEYLLVDNINDIYPYSFGTHSNQTNWGLSFSYFTQSSCSPNKDLLLLTTDNNKVIVYDINDSIPHFDFIYLSLSQDHGRITNITNVNGTSQFHFSWDNTIDQGISTFDLSAYQYIGVDNQYSNTIVGKQVSKSESSLYVNKIYNYNDELLICGNNSLIQSSTYSVVGGTVSQLSFHLLDDKFESRLKSKMLFLDYDIASKLNFFTDTGEYRLPNTVNILLGTQSDYTISSSTSSQIKTYTNNLNTIQVTQTLPQPLDIVVNLNLTSNQLTNLNVNLKAPNGKIINLKRDNTGSGTNFVNTKFTTSGLYSKFLNTSDVVYDNNTYQMDKILNKGANGYLSNTTLLLDLIGTVVGNWTLSMYVVTPLIPNTETFDPLGFGSISFITKPKPVLTGELTSWDLTFVYTNSTNINLTETLSNLWFNPLVHGATAPSFMTQSETNWLTYWKDTSKTFEYYADTTIPLDESTRVEISTTFSYSPISSSYKLFGSSVDNTDVQVSRLAPSILDNEQSKFDGQGITAITFPTSLKSLYVYDYIMVLKVDPTLYKVNIGDVIRLESDVVDGNFVVNRIETLYTFISGGPTTRFAPRPYKYVYMFTNFNDNITTNLTKTTNPIVITNLNKYHTVNELEHNFNLHPISNGYELVYNNVSGQIPSIDINAKFNNLTAYYNLATNVFANDTLSSVIATMSYTDGFLKFGYTPTYNLLDYLEQIDDKTVSNPKFYADKEYLAMPDYRGIPSTAPQDLLTSSTWINYNGMSFSSNPGQSLTSNKILFGEDLRIEWESIFVNTFVDVTIYTTGGTYNTERLLVMKKSTVNVTDTNKDQYGGYNGTIVYIIEFHRNINYTIGEDHQYIDIKSRRKLIQISQDLQELNNIQRARLRKESIKYGSEFYTYEREMNFKISTDSYAKILLSDVDTIKELSALIYIDYKNELAMNMTRLSREYNLEIQDTSSYLPDGSSQYQFYVICKKDHDLKTGDAVVLEFNGGTQSSQFLNQQYFGYHNVTVVTNNSFYIDVPLGTVVAHDSGFVKYVKSDPFLNYQPVDIIDVGIDKRGKNAVELSIDNLKLSGDIHSLINVDFNKFRFRLVDGLTIETLSLRFPWVLEAEIRNAIIGTDGTNIIWYKGIWECGRWFGGTWISGIWKSGDWYGGTWNAKKITDHLISVEIGNNTSDKSLSTWFTGRWYDGTWNDGTWVDGRWYGGTWNAGDWYKGIWNDGTWNSGEFSGGIWVTGTWNNGILNCNNEASFWIDGKWNGGDFENGMWYKGIFEEKNNTARFGTKAYNSRTANWHSGEWLSGSFYSRLISDNNGVTEVSESHKYSIWHTGNWYTGDLYGGIIYDINFKAGTWHGGILEDIQVINFINDTDPVNGESYIKLNGVFRFKIGDEISILSNKPSTLSTNGIPYISYFTSDRYKVLHADVDLNNKTTKVYINLESPYYYKPQGIYADVETNLRVVSRFKNATWESGIWTNGIFETGLWKGGIWYNGIFGEKAKWN
jgi:hypothetical protein